MNIFIIGISGRVGSRVAKLLVKGGDTVCGLYRRHEQRAALHAVGASGALGDLATIAERELAVLISGADVLVFSATAAELDRGSTPAAVDGEGLRKAISAARFACIKRILLVSVFPEEWRGRNMPASYEHYMSIKKRADADLVRSGLDWLILRPASLTDDPGTGTISLSAAEIHTRISRDDVAATIAALLHSPRLRRKILEVTTGNTPIVHAIDGLLD